VFSPHLSLVRPGHWTKNVFVLAPLVFAQRLTDAASLRASLLAFVAFCAASSVVYIVNDVRDREEDRHHPVKRQRPLAAGTVSLAAAAATATLLLAVVALACVRLGAGFALLTAVYLLVNLAYSLGLKRVVILDVMLVSAGFVLRVMAGGEAIGVAISDWLLLCTTFLALFLTFSKRRHELTLLSAEASEQREVLSHYSIDFLDQMINVVTASTVLAYALYCVSADDSSGGRLIATLPFVLFGVFRYLYLIYQRPTSRSPTEALLLDPPFAVNLLLWGALVVALFYV